MSEHVANRPKKCGDIDIIIKRDGTWWHEGTPIKRTKMVALFASVLQKNRDEYWLVTPVEEMRIQVEDAPFVITDVQYAPTETREYQGGGYKDRFLGITIRCYVHEEDAVYALEGLLEDIETVLEENNSLSYEDRNGVSQSIQQITIVSITTDEGTLEPYGVGEIQIEVRY